MADCHTESEPPPYPRTVKRGGGSAKIYRVKHRPGTFVYQVASWVGGKRERRTFVAYANAWTHAESQASAINTGRLAIARMKDSDREAFVTAERLLRETGTPLIDAVKSYVAAVKLLDGKGGLTDAAREYAERHATKLADATVAHAVASLIESKKQDSLNAEYVSQLRRPLERFAAAFRAKIADVKAQPVQAWIRGQGGAPKSQNNLRAHLVTLGNYARDMLNALPPGATEFEKVAKLRATEKDIEILHPEPMGKVLEAARVGKNRATLLWLALGGFAGLRPNEAMRLDWSEIDLRRGYIRVRGGKSKTGAKRLVPILPNLSAWLATLVKDRGPVFTHNANERAQYFARKQGVEIPFDGLRHSFGTFRVASSGDIARTALEMGNSAEIITKHYDRVVTPEEGKAWFAIVPPARPANVVAMPRAS